MKIISQQAIVSLFCCFLCIVHEIKAQNGSSDFVDAIHPSIPKLIPPSPSVASLGKFVDMPVNLYTGVPQISVPMFQVSEGVISVPVTLNFHASGMKVEEISGWVGTGWSLEAGGSISRVVRGLPDEGPYGFFDLFSVLDERKLDDVKDYQFLKNLADGIFDGEPDVFYYNFLGTSGKFFIHPEKGAVTVPFRKMEIIPYYDQYGMAQFRIRTADGMQYYFGRYHSDELSNLEDGIEYTEVQMKGPNQEKYRSAWHLMEVISPDKSDRIVFKYGEHYLSYDVKFSESEYLTTDQYHPCAITGSGKIISKSQVIHDSAKKLEEISYTNGSLNFYHSGGRKGLYSGRKLDSVLLKTKNGEVIRKQRLYYNYFEVKSHKSENEFFNYRLRLDSVQESGTELKKPPFKFTYENNGIPARDSNSQDHWGYFNGKNAYVKTTLPEVDDYPGADREADGKYVMAGSIKKITYPTGGYTVFDFEPHRIQTTKVIYSKIKTLQVSAFGNGTFDWIKDSDTLINKGNNQVATIKVKINFEREMAPHDPYVTIKDLTNGDSKVYKNTRWDLPYEFNLTHGHSYELSANVQGDQEAEVIAMISWEQPLDEPVVKKEIRTIGGLRIGQMAFYDNLDDSPALVRSYTYDKARVLSYPNYTYYQSIWKDDNQPETEDPIMCSQKLCEYLVRTSSNRSLLGSGGNPIVYPLVSEFHGMEGKGGKIEYNFSFEKDEGMSGFPFPPATSNEWQRGLLLEKTIYKYDEKREQYVYVKKLKNVYNDYAIDTLNATTLSGIKVGYNFLGKVCIDDSVRDLSGIFEKAKFYIRSKWLYEKSVTGYERGNKDTTYIITDHKDFFYDNPEHAQISRIITRVDSSTNRGIQILYPEDYGLQYNALTLNHIISLPIEKRQILIKEPANDTLIWGINRSEYYTEEPFCGKLARSYVMDIDTPIVVTDGLMTRYSTDDMRQIRSYQYNTEDRNLISVLSYDAPQKSILWGYKGSLPVAEVVNSNITYVAYTSFEETGNNQGNWIFELYPADQGYTGFKSHFMNMEDDISYSVDTIADFQLAFFVGGQDRDIHVSVGDSLINPVEVVEYSSEWSLNKFILVKKLFPSVVRIYGNGYIDELRLHMTDAQMVTYTHEPNIGITSKTDQNCHSVFYEYDDLGRLTLIRNHNKEILEEYKYFYYADIDR